MMIPESCLPWTDQSTGISRIGYSNQHLYLDLRLERMAPTGATLSDLLAGEISKKRCI
jgi:hypothetical protein